MKLSTVVVAGLAALCVAAAVTLPEKKDNSVEIARKDLEIYKNKLMYSEAIDQYKTIIGKTPYEDRYALIIELRDYCDNVGEENAFIDACRMAVEQDPSDFRSAGNVLDSMPRNEKLYSYIHKLLDTPDISNDARNFYSNYYDEIRGLHSLSNLAVENVSEWCCDSFAVCSFDSENDCVISTDGSVIVDGSFGRIDSYSPQGKYVAVSDKDQKVYVDTASRRKLVPYDYGSGSLVYYDYLGRLDSGLSNFRYDGSKWGYLTSSMAVKYNGLDAATPVTNGLFAYKSEGKWNIFYHGSSDTFVYSCDELYMEDDIFSRECVVDRGAKTRTYIVYAKSAGGSGWSPVKLTLDFSEKDLSVSAQPLGSSAYEDVRLFGEGCGAVKSDGAWKFIGSDGSLLDMGTYRDARSMKCGLCPVQDENGLWGYVDMKGKYIISPSFEEAYSLSSVGTAAVKTDGIWKLLRLTEYK